MWMSSSTTSGVAVRAAASASARRTRMAGDIGMWSTSGEPRFSSGIGADAGQQLGDAYGLAQREVGGQRLAELVRLPARDDADAQGRPADSRLAHEVEATAIGQPEIGDEHVVGALDRESLTCLDGAADGLDLVAVGDEERAHELAPILMVLDEQHTAWRTRHAQREPLAGVTKLHVGTRKDETHRRAAARRGLDLDIGTMAACDTPHLGESESGAAHTLGRVERLEGTLAHLAGHSGAGVDHLERHGLCTGPCTDAEHAAAL